MNSPQHIRPAFPVRDLLFITLMAVLITVCAWISIPFPIPLTLQTFGICTALSLLGGRRGVAAIVLYLLMGVVGLPVFSHFSGGLSALLGTSGGFLWGFLLQGAVYWLITSRMGSRPGVQLAALLLGLLLCYAAGTFWFMIVYARQSGPVGLGTALGWCVLPFLPLDLFKMALSLRLAHRLRPWLK